MDRTSEQPWTLDSYLKSMKKTAAQVKLGVGYCSAKVNTVLIACIQCTDKRMSSYIQGQPSVSSGRKRGRKYEDDKQGTYHACIIPIHCLQFSINMHHCTISSWNIKKKEEEPW